MILGFTLTNGIRAGFSFGYIVSLCVEGFLSDSFLSTDGCEVFSSLKKLLSYGSYVWETTLVVFCDSL